MDYTRFGVTADLLKTVNSIVSGAKPATVQEEATPLEEGGAGALHFLGLSSKRKSDPNSEKMTSMGYNKVGKTSNGFTSYSHPDHKSSIVYNHENHAQAKPYSVHHSDGTMSTHATPEGAHAAATGGVAESVQVPNHKKKVSHATFGEGVIIPELYENETLDILFKDGIKNVPYADIIGLEFTEENLDEWSIGSFFKKKSDRPGPSNKEKGFDNATNEYAKHLASGDHVKAMEHRKNIETKFGKGHAAEMHEKAVKKVADDKVANKKKAFSDHYEHIKNKESAKWDDRKGHNEKIKAHYDDVARVHGKETADDMKNYAEAKHKLSSVMSKHDLSESYTLADALVEEVLQEAFSSTDATASKDKARLFANHIQAHINVKDNEDNLARSKERREMAHDLVHKKYGADCAKDLVAASDASHKIYKLGYEGSNDTNETKLERAKAVKKRSDIMLAHGITSAPFDRSY